MTRRLPAALAAATLTLTLTLLLAGGCFAPRFADGEIECAANRDCPPAFHCASFSYTCRADSHDDQAWVQSSEGLFGGSASWVAFDPHNHFRAWASTLAAGIFRSEDGGSHWKAASTGLATRTVHAVAIDPANGDRLAAATAAGTYFSSDGGASWNRVGGSAATVETLRVTFDSHGTIYATSDRHVYHSFGSPPELSDDAGFTDGTINDLVFDEQNNGYVGLKRPSVAVPPVPPPGGIYHSDPTKIGWAKLVSPAEDFYCLATSGSTVFLGGQAGLWAGQGTSFTRLGAGLPDLAPQAIGAGVGSTVYAAFPSDHGLVMYRSTDSGATFAPSGNGIDPAQALTSAVIAIEPTDSQIALWPSPSQGLYRTANGSDWALANDGLSAWPVMSLLVDPTEPSVLLAAVNVSDTHGQLWRSSDGGAHWQRLGGPLLGTFVGPSLAASGSTLLRGSADGISYSRDHGATWSDTSADFAYSLAVAPNKPSTIYAPGPLSVQRSSDGGLTWGQGGAIMGADAVAVDPENADVAYAATRDSVFRTGDGGASWSETKSGLPHLQMLSLVAAGKALLVGTENGIYRSSDGATSWAPAAGSAGLRVTSLVASPRNPDRLWAAAPEGGVLHSIDGGQSWAPMNDGLADPFVNVVAVDPAASAALWAGTSGLGVVRTTR